MLLLRRVPAIEHNLRHHTYVTLSASIGVSKSVYVVFLKLWWCVHECVCGVPQAVRSIVRTCGNRIIADQGATGGPGQEVPQATWNKNHY